MASCCCYHPPNGILPIPCRTQQSLQPRSSTSSSNGFSYPNSSSSGRRRRRRSPPSTSTSPSSCCFMRRRADVFVCGVLPVDPWAPSVDSQSIASQLFAASLFPYLGFLYFITKSNTSPKLTLFGFYFLLAFVAATIPAGIYAKVHYGTSLANVDWLHGGAESLLTITNLIIVLGLREALRKIKDSKKEMPQSDPEMEKEQSSV